MARNFANLTGLGNALGKVISSGATATKEYDYISGIDKTGEELHNILNTDAQTLVTKDLKREERAYRNDKGDAVALDENFSPVFNENGSFKRVRENPMNALLSAKGIDVDPNKALVDVSSEYIDDKPVKSKYTTFDVTKSNGAKVPTLYETYYKDKGDEFTNVKYKSYEPGITKNNLLSMSKNIVPEEKVNQYKYERYKKLYNNAPHGLATLLPKPEEIYKDGKFNDTEAEKALGKLAHLRQLVATPGEYIGQRTKQNALANALGIADDDYNKQLKKLKLDTAKRALQDATNIEKIGESLYNVMTKSDFNKYPDGVHGAYNEWYKSLPTDYKFLVPAPDEVTSVQDMEKALGKIHFYYATLKSPNKKALMQTRQFKELFGAPEENAEDKVVKNIDSMINKFVNSYKTMNIVDKEAVTNGIKLRNYLYNKNYANTAEAARDMSKILDKLASWGISLDDWIVKDPAVFDGILNGTVDASTVTNYLMQPKNKFKVVIPRTKRSKRSTSKKATTTTTEQKESTSEKGGRDKVKKGWGK